MICHFIVTLGLIMSAPTPQNTQGVLKVKQMHFQNYKGAKKFADYYLKEMELGKNDPTYPKIQGVDISELPPFECRN